jgi:hypothetical protein
MVLGQSMESFASAGMSGVCMVLVSLELAELQHELLEVGAAHRAPPIGDARLVQDLILIRKLYLLYRLDKVCQRGFGVTIEHACDRFEKEWIFQTGKAFAFAALQDHDGLCLIDFYDGHPSD